MGNCSSDSYPLGSWESIENLPPEKYVEDFVVVWLDPSDSNDSKKATQIKQLQKHVNLVVTCTHPEQCEKFISGLNDEKVFLIVSGSLVKTVAPKALELPQVESVYCLCKPNEVKKIGSIEGVPDPFTTIESLNDFLKKDYKRSNRNLVKPKILKSDSKKILFMYDQLIQELILTSNEDKLHDLIEFGKKSHEKNEEQLTFLEELKSDYFPRDAIVWYTKESCLYKMVNHALRESKYINIYKLHVFIRHLHEQILDNSKVQECANRKLYRGQAIDIEDFNDVKAAKGEPIFFRSFMSTSFRQDVALKFAAGSVKHCEKKEKVKVLFEIEIDSTVTFPYTGIKEFNEFDEDECLFTMGSIFRVGDTQTTIFDIPNDKRTETTRHEIQCIKLTLINDNDEQLMALKENLKNIVRDENVCMSFARVMYEMANWKESKYFYERVLKKEKANPNRQAAIYNNLGSIALKQQRCNEALHYYKQSLELEQNEENVNRSNVALTYQNIATVYYHKGDMDSADETLQTAITIHNNSSNGDLAVIATIYNNMACVLNRQRKHEKALKNNKKCLRIRQRIFPSIDPSLAIAHNSLAITYNYLRQCSEAVKTDTEVQDFAQKAVNSAADAVNIDKQALPADHPQTKIHENNLIYFHGENAT